MLHSAPFHPAQRPAVVHHSLTARQLQPMRTWSLTWLSDKAKKLLQPVVRQPAQLLETLSKRISLKKSAPPQVKLAHQEAPEKQQAVQKSNQRRSTAIQSRKTLYELLAGVDLHNISFPVATEYPPLLQAVLDFHPPHMLPTQLRIAKTNQTEERLISELIKCFMVADMRKFGVPFDAQFYDDWVFTVPPEGYQASESDTWALEQGSEDGQIIAAPSYPETVAAIGEPTAEEVRLIEKGSATKEEKSRSWNRYIDRAIKQTASEFTGLLHDRDVFNESTYDELQYLQLQAGLFQSLDHWAAFQKVVINRVLGSRVYNLNTLPGLMFTLATRYSLPLEVVVTMRQVQQLFAQSHIEWTVDQCVAFLHSLRTCLSQQYMAMILSLAKNRLLRAIPQMNTQDILLSLLGVSRAAFSDDPNVAEILRELLDRIPDENSKWTFSDIILAVKALTYEPRLQKHVASVGERLLLASAEQLLSSGSPAASVPNRSALARNQTAVLNILSQMHNSSEVNVLLAQVEQSFNRSEDILGDLVKRHGSKVASVSAPTHPSKEMGSEHFITQLLGIVSHLYRSPHSLGTDELMFDIARKVSKMSMERTPEVDINELVGVAFGFRNHSNSPASAMDPAAIRSVALLRKANAMPVGDDATRAAVFQLEGYSALVTTLTRMTMHAKGHLLPSVLRRALEDFAKTDLVIDNNLRALLISWTVKLLTSEVTPTDEEAIALANQVAQCVMRHIESEDMNEHVAADFRFWASALEQKIHRSELRADVSTRCLDLMTETKKAIENAVSRLPKNIYSA